MPRKVKPAIVLVSDIGAAAADLYNAYDDQAAFDALRFVALANPAAFVYLRDLLNLHVEWPIDCPACGHPPHASGSCDQATGDGMCRCCEGQR